MPGIRFSFLILLLISQSAYCQITSIDTSAVNIVFTADVHYGITRKEFRGHKDVPAKDVNAVLVAQMNTLPSLVLPDDGGINAGNKINTVDYLMEGGDISNRMEPPVQTATASWAQFENDFIKDLKLTGLDGRPARLLLIPGNHDASNAIGYPKPLNPITDPTAMINMYNLEMKPQTPLTQDNYDYETDKINYSRYINGVHFVFVTIWPDSVERIWMKKDLDTVATTTPVIIVAHDPPSCDARHFTNPLPPHEITSTAKFQNLVAENYKDGSDNAEDRITDKEQRGFVAFLKAHPNIKAYFHGHENWTEFYTYKGPDNDVYLPVFRVDSPMKGKYSSKDETLLSFELITFNRQKLTVRECLWNTKPSDPHKKIKFSKSSTIML